MSSSPFGSCAARGGKLLERCHCCR
jgi:hypothetical protein